MIADTRWDGRNTSVVVMADKGSFAADLLPYAVGHGTAKCRKDDHFDQEVGAHIATARAIADLARQYEEAALKLPKTELQHQLDELWGNIVGTTKLQDVRVEVTLPDGRQYVRFGSLEAARLVAEVARLVGGDVIDPEGLVA